MAAGVRGVAVVGTGANETRRYLCAWLEWLASAEFGEQLVELCGEEDHIVVRVLRDLLLCYVRVIGRPSPSGLEPYVLFFLLSLVALSITQTVVRGAYCCVVGSHAHRDDASPVQRLFRTTLNPHALFCAFQHLIAFDVSTNVDFLISNETDYLEYLLRYVRMFVCIRMCIAQSHLCADRMGR